MSLCCIILSEIIKYKTVWNGSAYIMYQSCTLWSYKATFIGLHTFVKLQCSNNIHQALIWSFTPPYKSLSHRVSLHTDWLSLFFYMKFCIILFQMKGKSIICTHQGHTQDIQLQNVAHAHLQEVMNFHFSQDIVEPLSLFLHHI